METRDERRLLLRLQKQMANHKLLIIDELGFVPLSKTGAELLFELISQRYERGAILITSNLSFEEWTARPHLLQPELERFQQWRRPLPPRGETDLGRPAVDLGLDPVELGDAPQTFCRDRRAVALVDLAQLACAQQFASTPESLRRSWPRHPPRHHPAPVQPLNERLELRPRQPHHAILHRRPGEAALLEALVDHDEAAAVPEKDLRSIAAPGAEDHNQARMRVEAELAHRDRPCVRDQGSEGGPAHAPGFL